MKKQIIYTGKFSEFFFMNLGLSFLGIITLGLGFIYQSYWNQKYFFEHLEIKEL